MGRGRAPCCDKSKVKKGPWSAAEDFRLISFIQNHGHSNWRALPRLAGLLRCGKSCRLRWINYLRPDVKRGNFTPEEEETIINLHSSMGNKWSKIASHLPGRTDNEIKNVWNTHLKKRLMNGINKVNGHQAETKIDPFTSYSASPSPSSSSCISYGDILNSDKGSKQASASPSHSCDATIDVDNSGRVEDQAVNPVEIPLESDAEFWKMLEDFDPVQPQEYEVSQSSNLGEVEYKKWLRYLENELGLVGGCDGEQQQQLENKISDPAMAAAYFSTWPSSPKNVGI